MTSACLDAVAAVVLVLTPRRPFYVYSDHLFKLVLIGDSGVGKSCLLLRFAVRQMVCGYRLMALCSEF